MYVTSRQGYKPPVKSTGSGAPVDPSHQPVERYPGGSGGKVEHGELCLPVTSVFYHNLFFLVCFCQLLLSSAW